jgi:hypothetical protein
MVQSRSRLTRILERQNVLQTSQILFRRICVSLVMVLPFKDSSEAAEPRCATPSGIKLPIPLAGLRRGLARLCFDPKLYQ